MMDVIFSRDVASLFMLVMGTNIFFGYLRASQPRRSRKRARCIYIPIVISIILRRSIGVSAASIPCLVVGAILGQVAGGYFKNILK